MQYADLVDRLLGQDGALEERPAQVLLLDAAALAAVDEQLRRLARVLVVLLDLGGFGSLCGTLFRLV